MVNYVNSITIDNYLVTYRAVKTDDKYYNMRGIADAAWNTIDDHPELTYNNSLLSQLWEAWYE